MKSPPASNPGAKGAGAEVSLDPTTQILLGAAQEERRTLGRAFLVATLLHLLLLSITFPNLAKPRELSGPKAQEVYVVQQVRFKPPAKKQQQEIPKRKTKRIPIPDPTPDDPEPIRVEEIPIPDLELPEVDVADFGIPDAPPGVVADGSGGPIQIGEGITAPEKIFSPQPKYTEEARQSRIQGTVILQAVIDALGNVSNVQVLKGLPLGLDESAIETVQQWKFKPARRGDEPVAVYLSLLVNFSLQ